VLAAATPGLEGELGSLEAASATFVVVLAAATSSDETTASIIKKVITQTIQIASAKTTKSST
jgi:hypothetical protein